ncbi:GXWXG domain-containing protein [Streptomyces sp. NPDC048291]|uniref:GXWXG domain-containing protein n=1 Tax=Streptomyces sp. NPDC048291 TaxID=3365530 RepID=UPI003718EC35
MDEPDLPRRLPHLHGALRHAATSIRLVNDLRGHRREQADGQVDALTTGLSELQARRAAADNAEECRLHLAPLTATAYGPAVALERVLLRHTRMYEHSDPVRPRQETTGSTLVDKPTTRRDRRMATEEQIPDIITAGGECDNTTLERIFGQLEPVDADFLIGAWKGGRFERGTENAGLMEQMRWYGKRFVSEDHVEPLLCTREDGTVYSFEEKGLASIRQVVFRGEPPAAMVYGRLAVMDKKGDPTDFYFHLTRVPDPTGGVTAATAAVLRSADGDYSLEEVGLAKPGPGELRVKIAGAGLCHTEQMARSDMYTAVLPMMLGHEGAGVVEEIGEAVTGIRPGDHVVLSFDSCGACANCHAGHPSCCETFTARNRVGVPTDGSTTIHDSEGKQIAARWFGQSSLATHAIATARNSVVVLGAGSVGLSAVMAARPAGAARIIAVDLDDERLSLARELGRGVQYGLDTTEVPPVITAGIAALRTTGTMGLVGVMNGLLELDALTLGTGETLTGIVEGDPVPQDFIPELITLWQRDRFPFDRFITAYPLSRINEAEQDMLAGRVVKPVLVP